MDIKDVRPALVEIMPGVTVSYRAIGPVNGIPFILLPGMGSDASTMHKFPAQLAAANPNLRVVVASPRCMDGGSRDTQFDSKTVNMHVLAKDVILLIEKLFPGRKAFVAGWAYGHRTARTVAADRPDLVSAVVMYASGGQFHAPKDVDSAMRRMNKEKDMPWAERVKLTKFVLASDKTPDSVVESLMRKPKPESEMTADEKLQAEASFKVLRAQSKATFVTNVEDFVGGGSSPILLMQGKDDRVAIPMNGWALKRRFPDRIRLVDLDDAGHYLIYEQAEECVKETLKFIDEIERGVFDAKVGNRPDARFATWDGKSRL